MSYRGQGDRHAQRQYPQTKPKVQPTGTNTAWIPDFAEQLTPKGLVLTVDSVLCLQLGDDVEQKLRKLSSMGLLEMRAVRKTVVSTKIGTASAFSHYEWTVV